MLRRSLCVVNSRFLVAAPLRSFNPPKRDSSYSSYFIRTPRLSPTLSQFDTRAKKKKGGSAKVDSAAAALAESGVDINYLEAKMNKTLDYLTNTLSGLHTERLSPSLIENVMVELPMKGETAGGEEKKKKKKKGAIIPLRSIADISILDHRTLIVHPHDETLKKSITKALNTAGGGFSPQPHEGSGIKVPVPKMTVEFREQLEKTVNKHGEECKESLRRIRREGMDQIKKIKSMISEDDARRQEKQVKDLLDKMTKGINDRITMKVAEINDNQ